MQASTTAVPIQLAGAYALIGGMRVIRRDNGDVQIGIEPGRRMILRNAPVESMQVLCRLDGSRAAAEVLSTVGGDPLIWSAILAQLQRLGILVDAREPASPGPPIDPGLDSERHSLVHRYGVRAAGRLLRARQDAVVVVSGSGMVASAIADVLAVSGVGHVHQSRDTARGVVADPSAERFAGAGAALERGAVTETAMAARLRTLSSTVRTHAPAAHQHPMLVVLAGEATASPWRTAELCVERLSHLLVSVGLTVATVGPLVLPGRSACANCVTRHRSGVDPGWAAVSVGLAAERITPPAALAWQAACVAAADALALVDGIAPPRTVDGTVEWSAGDFDPRRRSWSAHPDCPCGNAATPRTTDQRSLPPAPGKQK